MKKVIILMALLMIPCSLALNYMEIHLDYSYGDLSLNNINVKPQIKNITYSTLGKNKAEIIDVKGNPLYKTNFEIPIIKGYDIFNQSHTFEQHEFTFKLNLPYYPKGRAVNIYNHSDKRILAIDLAPYFQGDTSKELVSLDLAPYLQEDIPSGENRTLKTNKLNKALNKEYPLWLIIAGVVIFIIIIIFVLIIFKIHRN